MKKPKAYIIQRGYLVTRDGRTVDHDYSSIQPFAECVTVLGELAEVRRGGKTEFEVIREALLDFCEDDFLVLSGDPIFCGYACLVAECGTADSHIKVLKWDRKSLSYVATAMPIPFLDDDSLADRN